MSAERTERATPRKRQKAAEKGDRVRSRELVAAAAMLAGVLGLGQILKVWLGQWASAYQAFLAFGCPSAWEDDRIRNTVLGLRQVIVATLSPFMLFLATVLATALLVSVMQGRGLRFSFETLQPKWSRLNPVGNVKNIFSWRGLARFGKSLLPAAALVAIAKSKIQEQFRIAPLSTVRLPGIFATAYGVLIDAAWIFLAWSAIDYLLEWRGWESRQKMTKQEMRDEFRQMEGNPQVRARIRSLRRQMRRKKLKADVGRASVVITNPTHYAVALSFDFETMEAPKVLAKGRNLLAEQIKNDARWAGIPLIENPPLARSLYKHVEQGQAIPFNLYAAVAGILAYLYRQQVEERVRQQRPSQWTAAGSRPGVPSGVQIHTPHKEKS